MRAFHLQREHDVGGVSGTGRVAEGVEFEDGTAVIRWCVGENRSTVVWAKVEDIEAVHGHGGLTQVVFEDDELEIKSKLAATVKEFDPSDRYEGDTSIHGPNYIKGYYNAMDRVVDLLNGTINSWTDGRPTSKDQPET